MVAKVISGKNIRGVLNYNENKVKAGVAECIMASKFGCKPSELTFSDKFNRFDKLIARNRKTKTNTLHISLNFDVGEKIETDKLSQIISMYMNKIGFGEQPYLAYRHLDAAHPHVHIVTTNVQATGQRIDIHNIGRNQSEKARKEIEKQFALVKAESKKKVTLEIKPIDIQRATYGKSETKRSISNIVRFVTRNYRYTSIAELNAALKQFNVTADRGKEGTQMYAKKGLLYSLLDSKGNKIGVPIKASAIYGKPMLSYLEKQFKLNSVLRTPHKEKLKTHIDNAFKGKQSLTRSAFITLLSKQGIYVLFRQNEQGLIYGITFVDNKSKVVFNGSDLGKQYTAKAILARLQFSENTSPPRNEKISLPSMEGMGVGDLNQTLTDITTAQQYDYTNPDKIFKRRRKKKRKGRSR